MEPSLPVDTKDQSLSIATCPKRECHNANGEVKDVEVTIEPPEEEMDELLEP